MTFHARLTELLEKATKGPYCVKSNGDGAPYVEGIGIAGRSRIAQHCNDEEGNADAELHALFLKHSEAIRDLVVAAERIDNLLESGGFFSDKSPAYYMLHNALAKLEES